MLDPLRNALLWIGGVVAAIIAILSSIGFLATVANLNLLGVDMLLLEHDPLFYLARGALVSTTLLLDAARLVFVLSFVVVLGVAAWPALRSLLGRFARRVFSGRILTMVQRYGWIAAYLGLFAYVYFVSDAYVQRFAGYLSLNGVLSNSTLPPGAGPGILEPFCLGPTPERITELVVAGFILALCCMGARALTVGRSRGSIFMLPFLLLLLTFVYVLPSAYGALLMRQSFTLARVRVDGHERTLVLIHRAGDQFLFWDREQSALVWIPERQLDSLTLSKRLPLRDLNPALAALCQRTSPAAGTGGT